MSGSEMQPRRGWLRLIPDALWLLVFLTCALAWAFTFARAVPRYAFGTISGWRIDQGIVYVLVPLTAPLLIRMTKSNRTAFAIWRGLASMGGVTFAVALVVGYAGHFAVWPHWVLQPLLFVAAGFGVLIGIPLILLPVGLYVRRAANPRTVPVMGMTAALTIFANLQPFLSIIVFAISITALWIRDRSRSSAR